MKPFDLKKFREDAELTQQEFADRLDYSQATISRIESGEKTISDKLLMKIENGFRVNLDDYKKYEKNKKGITETHGHNDDPAHYNEQDHSVHGEVANLEFERKYLELLEEKSKMDTRFHALSEEHKLTTVELLLIKENNTLLRKIVANTDELLLRFQGIEK